MTDDEALAQLLAGLRSRLSVLAADHAALLRESNGVEGWYGPATTFVLEPAAAGATRVVVFPEDAYTTWVEFARDVRVEVPTQPGQVAEAVDEIMQLVEAIAAGRARHRLWYAPGGGKLMAHQSWVQLEVGGRWACRSSDGRIPGRLTRRRYEVRDVEYAPFS